MLIFFSFLFHFFLELKIWIIFFAIFFLSNWILLLFNILLSGYLFNPENIGLAGSGSIAYTDMRSVNPATLTNHKGFSMQIIGANVGLGNSVLSISDYNDINGANFDDTTASKYFLDELILT